MPEHLTSIDELIALRDAQQKQGSLRAAAATDREVGIRLAEDGSYERGLRHLQAARGLFGDDSYDGAVCDHSIGIVLAELARYEESAAALGQPLDAIARFEAARRIHVEMNTADRIAACDEGIECAKAALHLSLIHISEPTRPY